MEDMYSKREAARKRVKEIKSFHAHVVGYIVINIFIVVLKFELVDYLSSQNPELAPEFYHWIDINVLLTPLLWGIGLLIHGLYVYRHKFTFLKTWEERQIKKILEEEEANLNNFK